MVLTASPIRAQKGKDHETDHDISLRQHLLELLKGGSAHARFEEAIAGIPAKLRGQEAGRTCRTPPGCCSSTCASRNGTFSNSAATGSMFPPIGPRATGRAREAPPSAAAWNASIKRFRQDLKAMQDLVANPKTDLYARIPWGDGQTILREALLVADHNAYHVAQMVDVRRLLGAWPEK